MIIPEKEPLLYNPINQFIYFHSNRGDTPVSSALVNEAHDIGFLPMKEYYFYGAVEIDQQTNSIQIFTFKNDRDMLVKFLKLTKARDIVLFNYAPQIAENKGAEPITRIISDFFSSSYAFIGSSVIHNAKEYAKLFGRLGVDLNLQTTGSEHHELALCDLALLDNENSRQLLIDNQRLDFIALRYDIYGNGTSAIESIFIGSNNDYLRIINTPKFFCASLMYPAERGKREKRGGKIMGGNCIKIDFAVTGLPKFEVFNKAFKKPYNNSLFEEYEVVGGRDLNLEVDDSLNLLHFDKELKVFTNYIWPVGRNRRPFAPLFEGRNNFNSSPIDPTKETPQDYWDRMTPSVSTKNEWNGYKVMAKPEQDVELEKIEFVTKNVIQTNTQV